MSTAVRGNQGEAAVLGAFVQAGFGVLLPFGEGRPYDLVVELDEAFLRVQCKTAWPSKGCLLFNALATDHGRGALSYIGRADVFGVYFPVTRRVYLVPVAEFGTEGRLRLEPARNNQKRGIRLACDYEFNRWTAAALTELVSPDRGVAAFF